jgi:SAM-dependent methyltransferase
MDPDEHRAESRERWENIAPGWESGGDLFQAATLPVAHWMVEHLEPQPGQTVLELAAGPGDTGFLAAELIQPGGKLISTDFAEPMLEVARQRAKEKGVDNVEFRVVDAESIDVDTASIDAVLCRWGYMLMADPGAALQETRRVLRPGGRVALAAWAAPEHNQWAAVAPAVLVDRGIVPPPEPGGPSMFAFAPPGRIEELLRDAGFDDVVVEHVDLEMHYESLDGYFAVTLDCSRPLADALEQVDDAERDAILEAIGAGLAGFRQPDGSYRVPGRTLVAAAGA